MVADFLANEGSQGRVSEFREEGLIQGRIWGLVRMDRLGMPYIHY